MNGRQTVFFAAKVAFAVVIALWVFHRVDAHRVWITVRDAQRGPILLGIILGLMTIVIAGWRWQRLLRIFGIGVPLKSLICIVQIGQFFSVFLPGPIGDDLTRMLYVSRVAPGRAGEACTTVLLDRCAGLVSVLVLAVCCIPWQWSLLSTSRQTYWLALWILSAGAFVCVCGVIFFLAGHPTHRWFERRLRSRPAHTLRDEAARIWGLLCDNKVTVAKIVGAAFVAQLLICGFFYLAGVSVGIAIPYPVWLTFIPIVLAANVLPITVAGIGVREYLLILFLGVIAGIENVDALAASLVAFSIILVICLMGGLLYIFYKPKTTLLPPDKLAAPGT